MWDLIVAITATTEEQSNLRHSETVSIIDQVQKNYPNQSDSRAYPDGSRLTNFKKIN
jgi:hypothetical protein